MAVTSKLGWAGSKLGNIQLGGSENGLFAKAGTFTLTTGTGSQGITGFGFKPKIVLIASSGMTGQGIEAVNPYFMMGCAVSSTERWAVGTGFQQGVGASSAFTRRWLHSDRMIHFSAVSDGATFWNVDLTSMDNDGITVNKVTAPGVNYDFAYMALGGDAITHVKAFNFDPASGTGTRSKTGIGFKPDLIMLCHSIDFTTEGTQTFGHFGFGAATPKRQSCWVMYGRNQISPTKCQRRAFEDAIVIRHNSTGITTRDNFVSMDSDGFTIDQTINNASSSRYCGLAIKGELDILLGNIYQKTSNGTTFTNCGFDPKAIILSSGITTDAGTLITDNARATKGFYDGTNQVNVSCAWEDGLTTARGARYFGTKIHTGIAYSTVSGTGVTFQDGAIQSVGNKGFTTNWTLTDSFADRSLFIALRGKSYDQVPENSPVEQLSNLRLWLRGDKALGWAQDELVHTWVDDVAGISFQENTDNSLKPTFQYQVEEFRRYSGVKGDGTDDAMDAGSVLDFSGKTGLTILAVMKANASQANADNAIIARDASGNRGWAFGITDAGRLLLTIASNSTTRTRRDGSRIDVRDLPCVVAARYRGSATSHMNLYVNGVLDNGSIDASVPSSIGNNGSSLKLFTNGFGTELGGTIYEVVIYDRDLTDAELTRVTRYFQAKYGLGALGHASKSPDVNCHQGYTFDGVDHYTVHTDRIERRTDDGSWTVEATNNDPFNGVSNVDHLGDPDYYNGKLYIPLERWVNCGDNSDHYIAVYDAVTLARDSVHDVNAEGHEASSVAVVPGHGPNGIIYLTSFCDGSKIWKYDLVTKVFLGTIALKTTIPNIQGITWNDRLGLFYVVDNNGPLYKVDLVGNVKMIYNSAIADTGTPASDHEGLKYVNNQIRWLIDEDVGNSGNKFVHYLDVNFNGGAENTFIMTQSVTLNKVKNLTASNTLVMTQEVEVEAAQEIQVNASNDLELTQQVRAFQSLIKVSQTISFAHSVNRNLVYNRSASDTLVMFQVAEATLVHPASNTITFSQDVQVEKTIGVIQTITFTQEATSQYGVHFDVAENILALTDEAICHTIRSRVVAHAITFSQTAVAQRVKALSASNLFVMSQAVGTALIQNVSNVLVMSHAVTVQKVAHRSIGNTLTLSQALSRNSVYVRSVEDTILFKHGTVKPTSLGDVSIPGVQVTKVSNYVVLEVGSRSIVLPRPLLGDGEGGLNKLVLHRTGAGGTFTYARRTDRRKLKYNFEIMRDKAYELRDFLLQFLSEPVTLRNWKGEIWYGNIMSNPSDLVARRRAAPCGEEFEFSLEFEGVRTN